MVSLKSFKLINDDETTGDEEQQGVEGQPKLVALEDSEQSRVSQYHEYRVEQQRRQLARAAHQLNQSHEVVGVGRGAAKFYHDAVAAAAASSAKYNNNNNNNHNNTSLATLSPAGGNNARLKLEERSSEETMSKMAAVSGQDGAMEREAAVAAAEPAGKLASVAAPSAEGTHQIERTQKIAAAAAAASMQRSAVVEVTLAPNSRPAASDNAVRANTLAPAQAPAVDGGQLNGETKCLSSSSSASSSSSSAAAAASISIVFVKHDGSGGGGSKDAAIKIDDDGAHGDAAATAAAASDNVNYANDSSSINSNEISNTGSYQCEGDDGAAQPIGGSGESLASVGSDGMSSSDQGAGQIYAKNLLVYPPHGRLEKRPPSSSDTTESRLSVTTESDRFDIVWSNLSYRIEPKWYKKINFVDRIFSHFVSGQTIVDNHSSATSTASSSANMNDDQHQMHASTHSDSNSSVFTKQHSSSKLDPIEIFSNLNGTIKSGQMTAVLGPSGAGKTTLLNCLTGKLRKGVSGHINLKGANGKHLKMCTIPQKDHLLELLTVEENLWFASKIKNPEYGFDHAKNIERVIDLLGLKRCRAAKIKKISGGQYKRVSIAQELLSNPDILVLDEPTSGLDSLTCFKTISMLRDLVELSANNDFMKPMAIIVTIHQPQPKVFNLFHHVYILANGGRVIYEGSPECSLETITKVTSLQPIDSSKSTSLTPGMVDPASFLIEIASEEYGTDVIATLSDYQRQQFHELNSYREARRQRLNEHFARGADVEPVGAEGGGQDNHSFAPEFEGHCKSGKGKGFSSNFVANQQVRCTKDNMQKEAKTPNGISNQANNYSSASKCKRRKRGAGFGSESASKSSHGSVNLELQDQNLYLSEQLLYTRVPNHKGRFWSHTATLTHRTLLTIRRDPLLMTSRVLFHLMIPILMGHVYGKATGAANACPHYEPEIDITQIPSLVENKRIEFMLEELHMSIENVSMFFIIMYAFAAAVLALNALSFPLNMQVLLKETRNGWYSMSSYVLAKTLADLPLELTMPCMTMLLVYPLTGQPGSYLQWRMLTICLIMTLCSLIAQTQALIVGALVMSSVQTAVFVSQASQLPWVILAGFTIRIKRLSEPLKLISLTSFYRLGCEAITLTRYGFGICPCNPQEITGEPVRLVGIPDQLRSMAQYWLESIEASKAANNETAVNEDGGTAEGLDGTTISSSLMAASTTTMMPTTTATASSSASKTDIFQHLANQLSYANSYGVNITSCDDVAPDRIRAINLGDNWLVARIWHLIIMLIVMKIILYYAVKFSIGIRL